MRIEYSDITKVKTPEDMVEVLINGGAILGGPSQQTLLDALSNDEIPLSIRKGTFLEQIRSGDLLVTESGKEILNPDRLADRAFMHRWVNRTARKISPPKNKATSEVPSSIKEPMERAKDDFARHITGASIGDIVGDATTSAVKWFGALIGIRAGGRKIVSSRQPTEAAEDAVDPPLGSKWLAAILALGGLIFFRKSRRDPVEDNKRVMRSFRLGLLHENMTLVDYLHGDPVDKDLLSSFMKQDLDRRGLLNDEFEAMADHYLFEIVARFIKLNVRDTDPEADRNHLAEERASQLLENISFELPDPIFAPINDREKRSSFWGRLNPFNFDEMYG